MPAPVAESRLAGRLVGQDDGGPPDQGPGDRDALAFAARQLAGPVPGPVRQADFGERVGRGEAALPGRHAAVEQSRGHVVQRGQAGNQEELLEHEADPARPDPGQGVLGQAVRRRARPRGTLPVVGRSRVPAIASMVDLPDPDGPTMAVNSPVLIVTVTDRSAATGGDPGCSLLTPASSSALIPPLTAPPPPSSPP